MGQIVGSEMINCILEDLSLCKFLKVIEFQHPRNIKPKITSAASHIKQPNTAPASLSPGESVIR